MRWQRVCRRRGTVLADRELWRQPEEAQSGGCCKLLVRGHCVGEGNDRSIPCAILSASDQASAVAKLSFLLCSKRDLDQQA